MKEPLHRPTSATTIRLRRHNTSPGNAGRSVIESGVTVGRRITRQSSLLCSSSSQQQQQRTTMKTNPYVGWFRHSPPTCPRGFMNGSSSNNSHWRSTCGGMSSWCTIPTSLKDCKNSPHIGWFRHAPPSRLPEVTLSSSLSLFHWNHDMLQEQELLLKLLQELNPALDDNTKQLQKELSDFSRQHWIVSGRLPGAGKDYLEGTRRTRSPRSRNTTSYIKNLQKSSAAAEGSMSTVDALSRLASWFLFPVAHDAESSGYRQHQYPIKGSSSHGKKKKNQRIKDEDGIISHILAPYLPTFLEEPPPPLPKDLYAGSITDSQVPPTSSITVGAHRAVDTDTDDSDGSDCDSVASSIANPPMPSSARDLSQSVSSLAEAYYAHQTATKATAEDSFMSSSPRARSRTSNNFSSTSSSSDLWMKSSPTAAATSQSPLSAHRLDYVITQMDIARMSRNASRHLDVQSILNLPVITYQKGKSLTKRASDEVPGQQQPKNSHPHVGWSWTIVEESESLKPAEECTVAVVKKEENEFCVICLDHFVSGDRLRVLPCDHSFHVGCIDRWLSGSQSFSECYTSGCPTCKKRPSVCGKPRSQSLGAHPNTIREEGKYRSGSLDGSVPSWAFAQIGSALLAQQEQQELQQRSSSS